MTKSLLLTALLVPLLTGGCLVKTAVNVATVPVKATGKAIDWTTTSQSEADRNAGRKLRKDRKRWEEQCRKDGRDDCSRYPGPDAR